MKWNFWKYSLLPDLSPYLSSWCCSNVSRLPLGLDEKWGVKSCRLSKKTAIKDLVHTCSTDAVPHLCLVPPNFQHDTRRPAHGVWSFHLYFLFSLLSDMSCLVWGSGCGWKLVWAMLARWHVCTSRIRTGCDQRLFCGWLLTRGQSVLEGQLPKVWWEEHWLPATTAGLLVALERFWAFTSLISRSRG